MNPSTPTPLDLQNAKAFTQHLISTIEKALITEIEKREGKVPSKRQMAKHGVERFDKVTGFTEYLWRGQVIVTVKPNQCDANGKRGTMLEINEATEVEL